MTQYRGRFAPSPSGDLHFGSLVAALGSYLDAKANHGQWLVRMEDIDPPREVAGAAEAILRTLEAFELHWDGEVAYQSQRHDFYQHHLDRLIQDGFCYGCDCTRKMIMSGGGLYQGTCQHKSKSELATPHSLRFVNNNGVSSFEDRLLGKISVEGEFANEDFILKRKDGLYAYQLVVVLDDMEQGITDVVRGSDLLEVTTRQMTLFNHLQKGQLKAEPINYLHLPLAITDNGLKLSKQNHAKALDLDERKSLMLKALAFLDQRVEDDYRDMSLQQLLQLATTQWNIHSIPKEAQVFNY
ncbi:tRNA glutamyl-Q(34) synthetase GluQRS [Psychrobium sp. MM17-31]|uniref:tRNA glutamyl-Q(34) synthetase GluQRS n=1 Tax=Psychrobium sp. MM17-31 TaxID=2917758 RepID=UPI001EF6C94E|nr:tRNA glutamyl-Q(34) synthetase GluQRS [Psychrobium sp. MM17-31]MCG7530298.1 tRNA glutamyl-Q(34) synthetase GluQRS [Psychrobium sp. MM17-31]